MFEEIVFLLLALNFQSLGIRGMRFKRLFSLDNVNLGNDIMDTFPNNGSIPDCSRLCIKNAGCEYFRIHSGICTLFNSHPVRNGTLSGAMYYISYEGWCPTSQGYTFEASIPLCFKVSYTPQNWTTAREHCRESGSQLLILNTEQRHTFMWNYLQDFDINKSWIGLHRVINGTYTWSDGSTFVYKRADGNPDKDQICGMISVTHAHDRFCFRSLKYICEIRLYA